MKVVKLQRGVRIACSDSEFEALRMLATHGEAKLNGLCVELLSPGGKRAIRSERFMRNEGRRSAASGTPRKRPRRTAAVHPAG
jgi:hypothetical protein